MALFGNQSANFGTPNYESTINSMKERLEQGRQELVASIENSSMDGFKDALAKWKEASSALDTVIKLSKEGASLEDFTNASLSFENMLNSYQMQILRLDEQALALEQEREAQLAEFNKATQELDIDGKEAEAYMMNLSENIGELSDKTEQAVSNMEASIAEKRAEVKSTLKEVAESTKAVKEETEKAEKFADKAEEKEETKEAGSKFRGLVDRAKELVSKGIEAVKDTVRVIRQCDRSVRDVNIYALEVQKLKAEMSLANRYGHDNEFIKYNNKFKLGEYNFLDPIQRQRYMLENKEYFTKYLNDSLKSAGMKTIDYEERLMYSAESFFNPNVDLSFYSEKEIEEMGRQAKEFLTKYEKKYSSLLERAEALDSRRDAIIEPEPEHQSKFRDALVSIMQIKKLDDIDRFFVEMPKDAVRVNGEEQTGLVPTTDAVDAIKNRLEEVRGMLAGLDKAIENKLEQKAELSDMAFEYREILSERDKDPLMFTPDFNGSGSRGILENAVMSVEAMTKIPAMLKATKEVMQDFEYDLTAETLSDKVDVMKDIVEMTGKLNREAYSMTQEESDRWNDEWSNIL